MAFVTRREGCPLGAVETWIFDLDNTLYPASCRLFDQVQARMNEFIAASFELSPEEAQLRRRTYFREHGTTLRGLMVEDGVDPHDFLSFVHEIDLACVPPDPALAAALAALPGRKIVHTNGSVPHAERLLQHLEIHGAFAGIIDIVAAGFEPKPALAGYNELMRRHGAVPATSVMVEDMAVNLVPAAALGMTTAWVRSELDWAAAGAEGDHIHYVVHDLAGFLAAAVRAGASEANRPVLAEGRPR
ncbi:MAG: pyrimidine 5'-nucleotidase [Alphaproteobacteria bacterium]|nr:pyrimidine 5'-nucleotidase [Alphaproteobacteria bacterium]